MAKQDLSNIFKKTEQPGPEQPGQPWPADNSDLDAGTIKANGVGLKLGEIDALDHIGEKYDLARNALIRLAVRRFILEWRAGNVDLAGMVEPKRPVRQPKQRLKLPK